MKISDWLIPSSTPRSTDQDQENRKEMSSPSPNKKGGLGSSSATPPKKATAESSKKKHERKQSFPNVEKVQGGGKGASPAAASSSSSAAASAVTPGSSKSKGTAKSLPPTPIIRTPPKAKGKEQQGHQGSRTSIGATPHSAALKTETLLPQTRIKVIMKSSPEIDQVGQDVVYLITKSTELFVDYLTKQTFAEAGKGKTLEYKHLAQMTKTNERLDFLREIIPVQMSARDALKEMAKQKALINKELLN